MMNTPLLITERLKLRPMCEADFNDFYEYFATKETQDNIGGFPPIQREAVEIIFHNNCNFPLTWAIEEPVTNKMIGDIHFGCVVCGYLAHIGYVMNRKFWGYGYMTEALNKITEFGFKEMDFGRIRAIINAQNKRSEAVLKRCGYEKEAFIRDGDFNGSIADLIYYSKANLFE